MFVPTVGQCTTSQLVTAIIGGWGGGAWGGGAWGGGAWCWGSPYGIRVVLVSVHRRVSLDIILFNIIVETINCVNMSRIH